MPEPNDDLYLIHLTYIREKQDEMVAHLVRLNGRVGKSETAIAVLQDRGEDAKTSGRKWGAGAGGAAGAFVGGLLWVLSQVWGGK